MARLTWATKEQDEWLKARIDAFVESHKAKTLSKKFWPTVLKEFHEKWPANPPTAEELVNATSKEAAVTKKRVNIEKRIQAWFHNHTRNVTSSATAAPRGVLELKSKSRKLQGWQAYNSMMYNHWKDVIEKEWIEYKDDWAKTHPDEKLPKNRFIFMVDFMRKKYAEETPEMKKKVEEYRESHLGPVPADDNEARNMEYQKAIDKLPRTLAMVGESIMEQTGWNVTVLVGGPAPDDGGRITTYLGHFGKNKNGHTFQRYLKPGEYDEHLLAPWDNFLHTCFSKEDQLERRLPDRDYLDSCESTPSTHKADGPALPREKKAIEDPENHMAKKAEQTHPTKEKAQDILPAEEGSDGQPESPDTKNAGTIQWFDYQEQRQKNIEENQKLLRDLGLGPSALEGLKAQPKKAVPAKRAVQEKPEEEEEGKEGAAEEGKRRVSESNKVHDSRLSESDNSPTSTTDVTEPTAPATVPDSSHSTPPTVAPNGLESSRPQSPALLPASPKNRTAFELIRAVIHSPVPTTTTASADTEIAVEPSVTENSAAHSDPSLSAIDDIPHTPDNSTENSESSTTHIEPLAADAPAATAVSPNVPDKSPSEDVEMADPGDVDVPMRADGLGSSKGQPHDQNVPKFLTQTLEFLRGACTNARWQALVSELLTFKQSEPITGKLSTTSRPDEVQTWIKGKKKDEIPKIKGSTYGKRFTSWWKALQPMWRAEPDGSLSQKAPSAEEWIGLKKGGSAGVYTVVMALSWWVRQESITTSDLSTMVDDVHWVLCQFTAPLSSTTLQKRSRDATEVDDSDRKRKTRRQS